jgi:hypothetical protein
MGLGPRTNGFNKLWDSELCDSELCDSELWDSELWEPSPCSIEEDWWDPCVFTQRAAPVTRRRIHGWQHLMVGVPQRELTSIIQSGMVGRHDLFRRVAGCKQKLRSFWF